MVKPIQLQPLSPNGGGGGGGGCYSPSRGSGFRGWHGMTGGVGSLLLLHSRRYRSVLMMAIMVMLAVALLLYASASLSLSKQQQQLHQQQHDDNVSMEANQILHCQNGTTVKLVRDPSVIMFTFVGRHDMKKLRELAGVISLSVLSYVSYLNKYF